MGFSRDNLIKLLKIKVVEATGVEPGQVLKTRKLVILRTDKRDRTDTSPITACKMHTKRPGALKLFIGSLFRIAYHNDKLAGLIPTT